ncbi:HK97-gp10 family putative phage morphogenesis protein [Dolosigranulum pigrum]|uniref:HK97-gp10 family putative phage morphogenesis protein n=1 Tax=Dolosigranulum pigrum TaxID=29394 RepID=UPI001FCB82C8|nr:HK97-gp10 family putative phage morphogenesis protein [Dolosigranulum pigrum]
MKVEINGLSELKKALGDKLAMGAVKKIVKINGSEMNQKAVRNAVFTRGYSTGQTRRSIALNIGRGGLEARVKPGTDYAVYVEYGTRFMSAQPFMRPSFNAQKVQFLSDMRRLVE